MKKVKVFLGGYINYTNAQNLNCRALAEYLDKDKFKIFTLTTHFGEKEKFEVNTFNCIRPFRITKQLGFLWGILHCDVAYLPKHIDTPLWVLKVAKLLNKTIFTTIEGNVTDESKPNLITLFNGKKQMQKHFSFTDEIYGITRHIIEETKSVLRIKTKPLLLGVDANKFTAKLSEKLSSIVFVGGLIKRKRVDEFLAIAELYPNLHFHIIGDGPERNNLQQIASKNIVFHGVLNHIKMSEIFQKADLMFLPAKSEGFPKVILEAASAGIPSIVYNTYGASDWMENKKNGFIATDLDDVKSIINELLDNLKLLQITSENAVKLAERFDWKNVIKDWEGVIINLSNGK
jgi:glycosyltransferase involved in cell wall biosynthesis